MSKWIVPPCVQYDTRRQQSSSDVTLFFSLGLTTSRFTTFPVCQHGSSKAWRAAARVSLWQWRTCLRVLLWKPRNDTQLVKTRMNQTPAGTEQLPRGRNQIGGSIEPQSLFNYVTSPKSVWIGGMSDCSHASLQSHVIKQVSFCAMWTNSLLEFCCLKCRASESNSPQVFFVLKRLLY